MAYLVCHAQKFGQSDLRGVSIHNNRESSNSSNKDIDYSHTAQNFDALTGENGNPHTNYRAEVEKRLQANYRGERAIRKDAVRLVSVVVSSSPEFFECMSNDKIKQFFNCAAEHLTERYGRENVVAAKVHMDERTPHMHFTFVPLRDGKLTARTILTRQELRSLQDDLPKALQQRGFDIERGVENSPNKHIPIPQFKRDTRQILEGAKEQETAVQQAHRNAKTERAGIFDSSKVVKIPLEDYKTIYRAAQNTTQIAAKAIEFAMHDSRQVLPPLNEKIKEQEQQISDLQKQTELKQKIIDELQKKIGEIEQEKAKMERKVQRFAEIAKELPQVREIYAEKVNQYNTKALTDWKPNDTGNLTALDVCRLEIKRQIVEEGKTFKDVDLNRVGTKVYAHTRSLSETENILKKEFHIKNVTFKPPQKSRSQSRGRGRERDGGMEM